MSQRGNLVKANTIGRHGRNWFMWMACIECGRPRWVETRLGKPKAKLCQSCSNKHRATGLLGPKSARWNGGRKYTHGYVQVYVPPDDFFAPMRDKKGYIREHRLVMAQHLGRSLHDWEIVHHQNHIRDDNRFENLQLVTDDRHTQITLLEKKIKYLSGQVDTQSQRVTRLEAEISLLRGQLEYNNHGAIADTFTTEKQE